MKKYKLEVKSDNRIEEMKVEGWTFFGEITITNNVEDREIISSFQIFFKEE